MSQTPESDIQRAVFQHLRWRGVPGLVAFHPANGGFRRPAEAAILTGLGVLPGVCDVIALHDGKAYALELKAPGRRPTVAQLTFIEDWNDAGGYAGWTDNLDRALAILEMWGLLRKNGALQKSVASSEKGCAGRDGVSHAGAKSGRVVDNPRSLSGE